VEQHSETGGMETGEPLMAYVVVIEQAGRNYSAYVPDLPGCVATGDTIDEVKQNIRDAITMHIDGLRDENVPIPQPTSTTTLIEV
jgi:predicted RNase H-like HicB family nuclease